MTFRYAVDLDVLDSTIRDMAGFDAKVERHLQALERVIETLHAQWHGDAATAQREAHARWTRGAAEMRQGLTQMREAARIAHGNYSAAGQANLTMFRQVR